MEEPDTNHKQLITMDITTDHVRRGLMSQFNQTSPQKELTKSLALITNGELSKQSSSGPDTPPRTPPPIPPRSPLCVSVTEIGGLPDEQGEGAQIKLLQEEIAKLKQEAKLKDKTVNKLQRKLQKHDDTNKAKKGIRQWQRTQPSIQDLKRTSVFEEPDDQHELFTHFVESERQYLNHLEVMDAYYYQPLKMMAIFKPEMLSILQLEVLFLNSPQILLNHRIFYDELKHIKTLPKNSRMEEFLLLLERSFPSFTIYQGFLSECRSQLLQKELRACRMKQQLSTLLDHFEQKVGGHSLQQMLLVPTDRISEYVSLLQMLMRCDVSDGVKKRVDGLITFLSNIKADVPDDKNQWECTLEKVTKVLQKLHPDGPIPLDIFDSNTKLVKHGQLAQVIKSKEVQKQCYLFSNYVAMAERSSENSYLLKEDGLRSLAGATIFKRVDMAGQIMQNDLKSGLQQDRLAFRINFPSFDHMVLRVARPNELTKWVEAFEKCIEDSQQLELEEEEVDSFIPDVELKIAAASLSKLFQHLTNTNSEFIDVFLTTYPCFTTPTEVLTALLNCIKEKTPEQNSQSDDLFIFSMGGDSTGEMENNTNTSSSSSESESSDSDSETDCPRKTSHKLSKVSASNSSNCSASPRVAPHSPSVRKSTSTDSDSSPYTSGVPVSVADNKEIAANGWQDPDESLRPDKVTKQLHSLQVTTPENSEKDSVSISSDTCVSLYKPTHTNRHSRESGILADCETDESYLVVNAASTENLDRDWELLGKSVQQTQELVSSHSSQDLRGRMSKPPPTSHSSQSIARLQKDKELEESSNMLNDVLNSLDIPLSSPQPCNEDDCFDFDEDVENFDRYTSGNCQTEGYNKGRRRRATENLSKISEETGRLSSSSLSRSQPDLTLNNIRVASPVAQEVFYDDNNEDELTSSLPASRKMSVQPHSSHDKLSMSLSLSKGQFKEMKAKSSDPTSGTSFFKFRTKKIRDARRTPEADALHEHPSSSLYFSGKTQPSKQASPSRFGMGIFRRKSKDASKRTSPRPSIDMADFDSPKTFKKGQRRATLTSISKGATPPMYMNLLPANRTPGKVESSPKPSPSRRASAAVSRTSSVLSRNYLLREKVFKLLEKWIDNHPEDFENEELRCTLENFLQDLIEEEVPEARLAEHILIHLQKKNYDSSPSFTSMLAELTHQDISSFSLYESEKATRLAGKDIDLARNSKESSKTFAEQITLLEYCCYATIKRSELLNCQWKKKDKAEKAPHVTRMITRTNELTSWVSTEILSRDSPSARGSVIEQFIKIAAACYKHNDMHCSLSIVVALSSTSIKRLKRTWDHVERKYRHKLQKLKDLTDHQDKCKKLRDHLEQITSESVEKTNVVPSCLPYVGAYLDMIYSLEIGVHTYNADGLVNFTKMTKLEHLIHSVLQYQQSRYDFEPRMDIISYITSARRLSDNELYELSVKKEPR